MFRFWVDVSHFSPCVINLSRNKNICCGLKTVVAKSRARVYFEQQIFPLLLVFHQTHNLSRNKCRHLGSTPSKSTNQRTAFLQPAINVVLVWCDKLITQCEKRETSTQMLGAKLRDLVSRHLSFHWQCYRL